MAGAFFYNQKHGDDQAFIEAFVARHGELDELVHRLKRIVSSGTTNHVVLVGTRGMGKTTLLRRLAIAITEDPELSAHFIPLRFREEQYNVHTLAAFWINCGESLASWAEANGQQALADRLDRQIETPAWRDAAAAERAFSEACREAGARRPVLLVDNLDLVLDGLSGNERWALRRVLQADGGPVVVGAAPGYLAQSADRDEAFYEFFYPLTLEPLTEQQLFRCLRAMADARPDTSGPVRAVLASQPERLKTIYALTGGNPRVLALLYLLLERGETSDVFGDLEQLLDQVTPYYKARVEEYQTAQQRAVIDAIALHWDPVLSRTIAETTGIEITTISGHLNRMRRDGFIQEVETSGARNGYQITERFLNIWYLMRHGTRRTASRLRWLTIFLARLYSPAEISTLADRARQEGETCGMHPDYRVALFEAEALVASGQVNLIARTTDLVPDATRTTAVVDEEFMPLLNRLASAFSGRDTDLVLATLHELETAVAKSDDDQHLLLQSTTLIGKGVAFGILGRSDEEMAAYDEVVVRFGDSPEPALREQVARALVNKAITLGDLGRSDEEIAAYDEVIARFGDATEPELCEQVARALVNKGYVLGQLGHSDKELEAYNEVVARLGNAVEPALREQVARALVFKGVMLGERDRRNDEIAAYDEVIARLDEATEPRLHEQLARALVFKGMTLGQLGRDDGAVAAYDEVVVRFGEANEPTLRVQVAKALVHKGFRLGELGRGDEEVAAYDEVVARFGDAIEPDLRAQVARALAYKGFRLGELGRGDEAIRLCDVLVDSYGNAPEPALRELVAMVLVHKGARLLQSGRNNEAITAYDEVLTRYSDADEPALREIVAGALVNQGITHNLLGRSSDALALYDEVLTRFDAATEPALHRQVARALFNKGITHSLLGGGDHAIMAYDEVVSRFGDAAEPQLRELAMNARGKLALTWIDLPGRLADAAGALDLVLASPFAGFADRANRAWVHILLNEPREAEGLLDQLQDMPPPGPHLIMAGIAFASDNLGDGLEHLRQALEHGFENDQNNIFGDLVWLLRTAEQRGFGPRVLAWLEESGFADQYAPLVVAFRAYVQGERFLLDANPEVRGAARLLYDRMSRHRGDGAAASQAQPVARRRGRPPGKRRGG